jgi:hypothetical protein
LALPACFAINPVYPYCPTIHTSSITLELPGVLQLAPRSTMESVNAPPAEEPKTAMFLGSVIFVATFHTVIASSSAAGLLRRKTKLLHPISLVVVSSTHRTHAILRH